MNRRNLFVLLLCALALSSRQAAAQQHPNIEKGFKPDNAYSISDVDVVNLFNGNLNVSIPIGGTYSVGGGLSYRFALAYAGNNWDYQELETNVSTGLLPPQSPYEWGVIRWAVPFRPLNAGMGWLFSLGRLFVTPIGRGSELVYQAPDGSEHVLPTADLSYTRTGTYIRQTAVRNGAILEKRILEFPDGTIKEFGPDGRLLTIKDQFGNAVTVTYYPTAQAATAGGVPTPVVAACGSSYLAWKVSDTHRVHYVYFLEPAASYAPFFEERLCQASLTAFGGSRANYFFTYSDRVISRQKVISREAYLASERPSAALAVPLLTRIELPFGSTYEMLYDAGMYKAESAAAVGLRSDSPNVPNQMSDLGFELNPGSFSGHLVALRLPTKGSYEWNYQRFAFPPSFGGPYEWDVDPGERWHPTVSAGVSKRKRYVDASPDTWSYRTTFLNDQNTRSVAVTTVDAPDGSSTENYFSIYKQEFEDERDFDYGAPYTRRAEAENPYKGMYISSRTTIPDVAAKRRSYVTYEWDSTSVPSEHQIDNRRLKSKLTVFEDGHETKEVYSDFDGLGHYRTTTTESTAGPVKRVTWKNYNSTVPPNGIRTIAPGEKWLTQTFDTVETADLDPLTGATLSKSRMEFCFDSLTGRVSRTRSLSGAVASTIDLLAVFKDADASGGSIDGNVSQEEYFGGDANPLPAAFNTCAGSLSSLTPRYRLKHGYGFGSRLSTQYDSTQGDNVNFKVLDLTIDPSSGSPSATRDVAGIGTNLTYDPLGRLTKIAPAFSSERRATSEFLYTEATETAGPSVTVLQKCPPDSSSACVNSNLPEVRYYYDSFGRLVQQRNSMGTASTFPWSASEITYDDAGRKKTSSVAVGVASGLFGSIAPPGYTEWKYDSLGRTKDIIQPDLSTVTFAYTGATVVARTAKVATAAGATDVTTTEKYDGFGRLVEVTENSGPTGGAVKTSYGYDVGDRLTSVKMAGSEGAVQNRFFDYDGRGFMRWESHPESGMTSYLYDARGHAFSKNVGAARTYFDQKYSYDSAERLTKVEERNPFNVNNFRVLKLFEFAPANDVAVPDYRQGKLLHATRYNYPYPGNSYIDTVIVTETYGYRDSSGHRTHHITDFSTNDLSYPTVTQVTSYDDLGSVKSVGYPFCEDCGFTGAEPGRQLSYSYTQGRVTALSDFVSSITYWPNGMRHDLMHTNGVLDRQTTDATGMPRPSLLTSGLYDSCTAPAIVTQSNGGVVSPSGPSVELFVAAGGTPPLTFQWSITGVDIPGATGSTLSVHPTSTTEYRVRVSNGCNSVNSAIMRVEVGTCVEPTITGKSATRMADGHFELHAEAIGTATISYEWRKLPENVPIGSGSTLSTGVLAVTTTFEVTASNTCGMRSETVTALVPVLSPNTLVASMTGTNQITLTWAPSIGATDYRVERRSLGNSWASVDVTNGTQWVDNGRTSNTTYAYRVTPATIDAVQNVIPLSAPSNVDLATTMSFLPVGPNIYATREHFDQLLDALNCMRAAAGWVPVGWNNVLAPSDPLPEPGERILARHVLALRSRMNEAMQAVGVAVTGYSDGDLVGSPIKSQHILELQAKAK